MNKRLEKFSKLIEQRRRAKAVESAEIQNASVGVVAGKVSVPVAPELPAVEEPVAEESASVEESTPVEESLGEYSPVPVPEVPVAEESVPVPEEPVAEEPVVPETPNRSRRRRGKKSKDAEE